MAAKTLDWRLISSSRLDTLLSCGLAFKWKYVDDLPGDAYGASALFGSVMHKALEWWAPDRSQGLPRLVETAWLELTDKTTVRQFLTHYAPLSVQAREVCAEIRAKRDVVRPRATKDFRDSEVGVAIKKLWGHWRNRLDKESPWRFTANDPLPSLYDESLDLAVTYAARWQHLPPSLITEFEFAHDWEGFVLRGYVDSIEPLVDRPTGEVVGLAVVDYKSEGRKGPAMKHWRQLCIYDLVVEEMFGDGRLSVPEQYRGLPIFPGIDYLRWTDRWEPARPRQFFSFGLADRERLLGDLQTYKDTVESGRYLPASKYANADMCDYGDNCCLKSCALVGGQAIPLEVTV